MCTNYRAGARDFIREQFHVLAPTFDYREEAFPGYVEPIVRLDAQGERECIAARFGLIPYWSKDATIGRRTLNARSETVAERPSYRQAWKRAQRCLVPMAWFYEPNYESGKSVRWKIERADRAGFACAAIWDRWIDQTSGEVVHSFSLLTVNADQQPVMRRMHKPGDEKRSVVIVEPHDYEAWLSAAPADAATLVRAPGGEDVITEAAPR